MAPGGQSKLSNRWVLVSSGFREPVLKGEEMIKQIKLTKEHLGSLEEDTLDPPHWFFRVVITPNWVSNGYWAIHKSLVINADDFKSEETVRNYLRISNMPDGHSPTINDELLFREYKDELIKSLFPKERINFVKTNEVITGGGIDRILFKNYIEKAVFINAEYVKRFELKELWGYESEKPFINAEVNPTLVIMPCKI